MNIVIIDDRSERQELKLGTFKKSPFISIYTKAEINDFFDSLKFGAIPKAFSTSDLLCIHDSIAEIKEAPLRKRLEEWCEDRKIPVIWFSGANTHPATIKKSLKYQCDVNTIYNRLKTFNPLGTKNIAEEFLFGNMYKISFLMCVRRLAVYLDSCGQLEELKSMEREFDNHDLRKMHKTILSEEKLTIENIFEIIKAFIALNTH